VIGSRGGGVPPLKIILPGGRPLPALTRRYPSAAERLYRLVAENRTVLGRSLPRRMLAAADRRIGATTPAPRCGVRTPS